MALIKCSECGKEISDKATTCPNCGCPVLHNNLPIQNLQKTSKQRNKKHGCLIPVLVIFILFGIGLTVGVLNIMKNPDKYDSSRISAKFIDVSPEEGKKIDSVLKKCGIEKLKSFEHDELLDGIHFNGETGYRLAINDNVKNIILYLNEDKSVYLLKYSTYDLYIDNAVTATIQDYTLTNKEVSDLMIKCEEKVKSILKSPSTANFPNILSWGFKKEKNIVTVQGYVDAQNSFGAEIRSTFQFIINTDGDIIQSFIFDNQEMITGK